MEPVERPSAGTGDQGVALAPEPTLAKAPALARRERRRSAPAPTVAPERASSDTDRRGSEAAEPQAELAAREPARKRRRPVLRVVLGLALLGVAVVSSVGCEAVIAPPAASAIGEAATVVVVDYGDHSSLVLPRGDGSFVEYNYGDHNWYAGGNTGVLDAIAAACWETHGTLGRRDLNDKGAAPTALAAIAEHVHALTVDRDRAHALAALLDARFDAHLASAVEVGALRFVDDEAPYWLLANCNHRVVDWLRALGCKVSGWMIVANYRVDG